MSKWFFPTRGYGEIEGFSNPGLEMFKGEPIRAMAREVCQNSLDAGLRNDLPVRIVFERTFMKVSDFPGMHEMRSTLIKCQNYWAKQGDEKTKDFVRQALRTVSEEKFFILRISDYNTMGLQGAFEEDAITPWKSLVQGNAFSIKTSDSAAGSYGIGKAAPFVVSNLQTVFYRTFDEDGVRAAQGVTHLVSFVDDNAKTGEDPIRRSTGYYGDGKKNNPLRRILQLDAINQRTESGTDLFIPAFNYSTGRSTTDWRGEIIIEILDNFLYSICSGKLEVVVDNTAINQNTVDMLISRYLPKTKHAAAFLNVINDTPNVIEEIKPFHNIGNLRLRVLYSPDANRKVLVVRNSGMKITNIPSLPKGIAFVGFLELQGEELNKFFRGMENPQHNKWEYKRHSDKETAKKYKEEVENWVREFIGEKIKEISGEEMDIDVSAYFLTSEKDNPQKDDEKIEKIVDTVKSIDIITEDPAPKSFKVKDIGGTQGQRLKNRMKSGTIDDEGQEFGHRTRTGRRSGSKPSGRRGRRDSKGNDKLYEQMHEVDVSARIIKQPSGTNKMIFTAADRINAGELEIVTVGENGKPLQMVVKSAKGINVDAVETGGHIKISNVDANTKYTVEFAVYAERTYAMGVRAYGN